MMRMVAPFHPVRWAGDVMLVPSLARCRLSATRTRCIAHKAVQGRTCHVLVRAVTADVRSAACFANGGSSLHRPLKPSSHLPPLLRRATPGGISHSPLVSGPSSRHLHHSGSPWRPQNARTQIRLLTHQADMDSHGRENLLDAAQQSVMIKKKDMPHNAVSGNINGRWGDEASSTSGMFDCCL